MASSTLAFDILARDRASKVFDQVGARSQTMGNRLDAVGKKMARAAGVVALGGIVALGAGLVKGVAAAARFEVLTAKTNAVIASTGDVANISTKGIQSLAASLENMSGVDEELIINSQNVLATFTRVRNEVGKGNDIFDQGTKAALDMSVALGTDLQTATIQIGKALQDPIRGVTALRRAGVQLSEAQTEQIRVMVEAGDVMGAQKVILAELATQFGGVAEAAGDTFAGKLERAKDALSDAARAAGEVLLPVLGGVADFVAEKAVPALQDLGRFTAELGHTFAELPGPVKIAAAAMAGIVAAAPLAVAAFNKVKGAIDAITIAYTNMGRAGRIATVSLGVLGVALAAGVTVLGFFAKAQSDAKAESDRLTGAFDKQTGALNELGREQIANEIVNTEAIERLEEYGITANDVVRAIDGQIDISKKLARAREEGSVSDLIAADNMQELIDKYGGGRDAALELGEAEGTAAEGTAGFTAATEGATGAIGGQVAELQALNDALAETYELLLSQRDAERGLEDAYDKASEAFKENGETLDVTTEKGRANQDALDNIADSALNLTSKMIENGDSVKDVQAKMTTARAEFVRIAGQMGLSATKAGTLADQLGLIPGNYKATVSVADQASAKLLAIRGYLAGIQSKSIVIRAKTIGFGREPMGGLQHGGPVRRGDVALVGEEGPELVRFTSNGEVIPHGKTMQMLRGKSEGASRATSAAAGARPQPIVLEFRSGGQSAFDQFMLNWVRQTVRVKGGSVQTVFGVS